MTVCVAALCNATPTTPPTALVVAADRMLTAGFPMSMEFEHPQPKIERLANLCVVMMAGDAALSTEIIRAARFSLQHGSGAGVDDALTALASAYARVRQEKVEQTVLRALGMSSQQFLTQGLAMLGPNVHPQIVQQVINVNIGVDLVVAGMDGTEARVGQVAHPGMTRWADRPGYLAVGSGGMHAQIALATSGQSPLSSLQDCAFRVYQAKRNAETAPGVGDTTDMLVLDGNGQRPVSDEAKAELERLYVASRAHSAADFSTLEKLL